VGADRRGKLKGRKGNEPFLQIPRSVLQSKAYESLDGWGVKLLVDIAGQYRGHNNGDLCAAFSMLSEKGWRSKGTLHKALSNLLEAGLIEQTRQGGRNRCSLYAVTWRNIDECKGKLDVRPTKAPSGLYLNIKLPDSEN
jgi:DNA-binding transcriptional ArsR family regulator